MRKFLFSFLSLLLILATSLPLFVQAETVLPFETTVAGTLSVSNPEDVYTITVQDKGTVKLTVNNGHVSLLLELRDSNNQMVETLHRIYEGGPDKPIWTQPVLLEPGEYHYVVTKEADIENVDYSLNVSYLKAENNETEPNQTIEEAMPLELNGARVKGLIYSDDYIDFYKLVLPEPGRLWIDMVSHMSGGGSSLYLANGQSFDWDNPENYHTSYGIKGYVDLEAGTYYYRKTGWEWNVGLYEVGATFEPSLTNEAEPNNSFETAIRIEDGKPYRGYLNLSDKYDFYQFEMPYDGYVTLNFSSEFGAYTFMHGGYEGVLDSYTSYGQLGKPQSVSKRFELKKGTHYFRTHKINKGGTYTFSIDLEPDHVMNFTDVSSNYVPAVRYLLIKEVTTGLTKSTFGTTEKIKRVDAAIWLAKKLNLDTWDETQPSFLDVPKRAWGSINALKKAGIVGGKSSTYFGANENVTRGEMALMLQKAYKLYGYSVELTFTDVSSRYSLAVQSLVQTNITTGKTPTTFGTTMPITRGEMALFLFRADFIKRAY